MLGAGHENKNRSWEGRVQLQENTSSVSVVSQLGMIWYLWGHLVMSEDFFRLSQWGGELKGTRKRGGMNDDKEGQKMSHLTSIDAMSHLHHVVTLFNF